MNFAFIMDVSILILLAATVFLAFRLSLSLRHFRESRFEMEGLVNRLTSNIDQAERAIGGMQNAARKAGLELDEIISDSKKLAGELRLMNESGNSLANRLEKIADKNRALMDDMDAAAKAAPIRYSAPVTPASGGFAIQDRDFGADLEDELFAEGDGASTLQTQAERELFMALQGGKGRIKGRA
jgi:hypothetical protein